MEIEVLAPEAQVGLQLRRGPRVKSAVQAHLAEVSFLGRHTLRLEQPYLQRIVRAPRLLRVRLNGFPQAAFPTTTFPPIIISAQVRRNTLQAKNFQMEWKNYYTIIYLQKSFR